jgi:hypothetical protein
LTIRRIELKNRCPGRRISCSESRNRYTSDALDGRSRGGASSRIVESPPTPSAKSPPKPPPPRYDSNRHARRGTAAAADIRSWDFGPALRAAIAYRMRAKVVTAACAQTFGTPPHAAQHAPLQPEPGHGESDGDSKSDDPACGAVPPRARFAERKNYQDPKDANRRERDQEWERPNNAVAHGRSSYRDASAKAAPPSGHRGGGVRGRKISAKTPAAPL